jgi:Zn-dependent protease
MPVSPELVSTVTGPPMLALARMSLLLLAVMIAWIFSVCVHEFSHALVAYLGGDRSVKDRGYLKFNPAAYIDPMTSLLLPLVFLALGGVPLPGGAVYIETHRLKSKHWAALVSAAGPASNFLLFLILAALVHPRTGLVDPTSFSQPAWAALLGTMTVLQLFAVFFNLIPVPPLDGFGIIEPYLPEETRVFARQVGWGGLVVLYLLFFQFDMVRDGFMDLVDSVLDWFGLPFESTWRYYNVTFFGQSE